MSDPADPAKLRELAEPDNLRRIADEMFAEDAPAVLAAAIIIESQAAEIAELKRRREPLAVSLATPANLRAAAREIPVATPFLLDAAMHIEGLEQALERATEPLVDVVAHLRSQLAAAEAEVTRVRGLIDRDRTGLAEALDRCRQEARGRLWVVEGRGSYEWNDDRYRQETGLALRAILEIVGQALNDSGKLADSAFHPKKDPTP